MEASDFSWSAEPEKIEEAKSVAKGQYSKEHFLEGQVLEIKPQKLKRPLPPIYLRRLIEAKDASLFDLFENAKPSLR